MNEPAPPAAAPAPSSGCLRWAALFALLGVGITGLGLAFGGYQLYQRGNQALDQAEDKVSALRLPLPRIPTPKPTPTPQLVTTAVLAERLRGASELTTAIFQMETVITESQDRILGDFTIGRTELLYVAHGQVRAGIDLAEMQEEAMEVEDGRLIVRLPPPRLLDRKIDVDKSYVYDLRRSLLGPVDPAMQTRAEQFALDKIVAGACEGGVLAEANDRAKLAVEKLLETSGYDAVVVINQPARPGECPEPPPATDLPPPATAAPAFAP